MLIKELKFTKDKDIVEKDKYSYDILRIMKTALYDIYFPNGLTYICHDNAIKYMLDCHYINNTSIKLNKSQINVRGLISEQLKFNYTVSIEGEITNGVLKTNIYLVYTINYIDDNIIDINLIQFHIDNKRFVFPEILPIIDRLVIDINAEPEVKREVTNIELVGLVFDEEYETVEKVFKDLPIEKDSYEDELLDAFIKLYKEFNNITRVQDVSINHYRYIGMGDGQNIHITLINGSTIKYDCHRDKENKSFKIKVCEYPKNGFGIPIIKSFGMKYK